MNQLILFYRENGDVIEAEFDEDVRNLQPGDLSTVEVISTYSIDFIPQNRQLIKQIVQNLTSLPNLAADIIYNFAVVNGELHRKDTGALITPAVDTDRADMKAQYQTAVTQLNDIIANETNANIKFLARVVLNILKLIKTRWGN